MAAVIRLYRRFYRITPSSGAGDAYTLIDPVTLSAKVYLRDTVSEIESVSSVVRESEGIYYADLNPNLYSFQNVYDLKWFVDYTVLSGQKTLITTFKLNPKSISGEISTEIQDNYLETEILDQPFEVTIINQS